MVILKQRFHKVKQGLKNFRAVWEKTNMNKYWKRLKIDKKSKY